MSDMQLGKQYKTPSSFKDSLGRLCISFLEGLKADVADVQLTLSHGDVPSMVIVGAGASHSSAIFLSLVLESYFSIPARAKTPYEYILSPRLVEGLVLISASGRRPDILSALEKGIRDEVKPLIIVTCNPEAPLLKGVRDYPDLSSIVINLSGGKEGFLGSRSLVAIMASLANVAKVFGDRSQGNLSQAKQWCEHVCSESRRFLETEIHILDEIARRRHLIALSTGWGLPCLSDFESKFVEGGLGWVEVSEMKNFSHGRFVNSFRHKDDSSFLLFGTPGESDILRLFHKELAPTFPTLALQSVSKEALGALELIIRMFYLFDFLATRRKVDVSRPYVPPAARRLHRAEPLYRSLKLARQIAPQVDKIVALKRDVLKASTERPPKDIERLVPYTTVKKVLIELYQTKFSGLVCDYDGTLVQLDRANEPPLSNIVSGLIPILKAGVSFAVMTGRGRSIIRDLRKVLPKSLLDRIWCYLYNGGALWNLAADNYILLASLDDAPILEEKLKSNELIRSLASEIETSSLGCQLTVHLKKGADPQVVISNVRHVLKDSRSPLSIQTSGRSVDIFPSSTSKKMAYEDFKKRVAEFESSARILVIGDQGGLNGNDYDLLQCDYSLSVDKIDWKPSCCFPVLNKELLQSKGIVGTAAVLTRINVHEGKFTLSPKL